MIKFNKFKLENGLEIYHVPVNPGSKVISVDVFYKVGSRNEVMGKSGIAHMLEHLNFKSTKNLRAGEFDEIVKGFGGVNNASTGFDYTHYFIKASNENLDKTLGLFAELMKNLSLKDLNFKGLAALVPLCLLIIILGIAPNLILKPLEPSVQNIISKMQTRAVNSGTKDKISSLNGGSKL